MKKLCYEAPDMEVIHIELEKGFMAASVVDKGEDSKNSPVNTVNQSISDEFDFTGNENEWK